jgi:hypothetical protein
MSINTTISANTSTTYMSATRSSTISGFAHLITVKLATKGNYPLLRAQFLSYLRSDNMLAIINDSIKAPSKTITKTTADGTV